ncbi:MAG: hypothetical protein C0506_16060 [Anaerolinea sp.]|nr:hypothetical protein [Anaerolinea sp.]
MMATSHLLFGRMAGQTAAGVFLAAVLGAACGGSGSPSEGTALPTLVPEAVAEMRSRAGPPQLAFLEDGLVTFEEYEIAVLATVQCLDDAGIKVGRPELRFAGKYYRYESEIPGDQADLLFPRLEACNNEWQPVVDAWYAEHIATEAEIQKARKALVKCLQAAGFDIPNNPTAEEMSRLQRAPSQTFVGCVNAIDEEYGLPGFAG